jgi:hypothetical protein
MHIVPTSTLMTPIRPFASNGDSQMSSRVNPDVFCCIGIMANRFPANVHLYLQYVSVEIVIAHHLLVGTTKRWARNGVGIDVLVMSLISGTLVLAMLFRPLLAVPWEIHIDVGC